MLFNSLDFLVFFPIVTLIYFVIPKKTRYLWLLVCSYYFYMCWNVVYALLLFGSTFVTWLSGLLISRYRERDGARSWKKCRRMVAVSFTLNLLILTLFKYSNFIIGNLNLVFGRIGVTFQLPEFSVLLPVGISFYIFQALSYTMDVYRGDVKVERNLLRYAVFVSFFPQLVAGPIERSSRLLEQFYRDVSFDYDRMCRGLLMMLWGYFQKMVIADRVAALVTQVFTHYAEYSGILILCACVLFAFQIYCDFGGYSCIAIGAAQVMGFELMENFRQPYLATSVMDFWKRWHISLTSWFRDYLYIPLGGNRRGKLVKYRNIMIVFLTSGLWHGANWTYIVWGGMNGLFQIAGELLRPARERVKRWLHIDGGAAGRILSMLITFLLVDFTWIFFRADSMTAAMGIIRKIFTPFSIGELLRGGSLRMGMSRFDFALSLLCIAILLGVDALHERGVQIRSWVLRRRLWIRWSIYLAAIFTVLVFGVYGPAFDATQFIYFQF